jgi:acyl phosphate:glycerol-3-phosphate acyltransferase
VSQFAVSLVIGYLIGSIPTAYIVVRLFAKKDIRQSGSGNVGAANTLKVTRSKFLSILVGCIDILKGIAAIVAGTMINAELLPVWGGAGVAAVVGHNYPVWLGFKGGRGLATACGATLTWAWFFPAIWLPIWGILKKVTGKTHLSSIIATGTILLFVLLAPTGWLLNLTSGVTDIGSLRWLAVFLCGFIIVKHIGPVLKPKDGADSE